jgi:nitrite reductase (NADH) small subunit
MREVIIGSVSEFSDPGRKIIGFEGFEVGVFKLDGEFFAYLNQCPHMGGPACQGKMIAKVEEIIAGDRTSKGMAFSKTKLHVVCPWHGFEFDIRTGVHPGNPRARLRKIDVAVSDGEVMISVPDARERATA